MTGKIEPHPASLPAALLAIVSRPRFWLRLVLALLAAWVLTTAAVSWRYTYALLHPACAEPISTLPGFQPVQMITSDGVHLAGWWRPPQNGRVIIFLPGHAGSRDQLSVEADFLAAHGYGILSLDSRGCSGSKATLGLLESQDALEMLEFVKGQPQVNKIALFGYSAGGAAAILAAGRSDRFDALVVAGNYHDLASEIYNRLSAPLSLEWLLQRGVTLAFRVQLGLWPSELNPAGVLPAVAPRPLLLIHGEGEAASSRARDQYTAAGEPKELWIVPGAGHGEYLQAAPQAYPQRILQFYDYWLQD